MAFRILYKTLLAIDVYHSYFLDNGENTFNTMSDDDKRKQLQSYDLEDFLMIKPTPSCVEVLRNHNLVFRQQRDRIVILAKVEEDNAKYKTQILLPEELKLTFYLYINDYLFYNYSLISTQKNRFYCFSNVKPDTEANPYSYIKLKSSNDFVDDEFLLSEEGSRTIWYNLKKDNARVGSIEQAEVIMELEDDDLLTVAGQEIVNQSIEGEKSKGLFGIVELQMVGDNNMDLIEVDDSDPQDIKTYLIDPSPNYKIHFDNQKTIWRYIKKSADEELETNAVKPLTLKGFIEIDPDDDIIPPLPSDIEKYHFPNPTADRIKRETDQNTNITTTYSEIFI